MPDREVALLANYLIVGAMLFALGAIGFLSRRNLILMFLCAEMMLQGVSLSLVAWGRYYNDWGGQVLVLLIITVAACEAAIALALIMVLFQRRGTLDVIAWQDLREADQPPYVEEPVPEEPEPAPPEWPHLSPAGLRPEIPSEQTDCRPHV
jgi:NADH-quinone oxidoreductase subunit K